MDQIRFKISLTITKFIFREIGLKLPTRDPNFGGHLTPKWEAVPTRPKKAHLWGITNLTECCLCLFLHYFIRNNKAKLVTKKKKKKRKIAVVGIAAAPAS